MTPVGVFFIYPNEDKLGFVNSANLSHSGARRKGGTLAVPLFYVSPLDNGEAECVVFYSVKGGRNGR